MFVSLYLSGLNKKLIHLFGGKSLTNCFKGYQLRNAMTLPKNVALMFLALCISTFAANAIARDSMIYRHKIKLDIVPLYSVFFDVRQQLRLGAEYEHSLGTRTFATLQLDAGLYDNYTYKKYHDFFSQTGGINNTVQKVQTFGFHLLPTYNYILSNTSKHTRKQFYTGITADFNRFFQKSTILDAGTSNTQLRAQTKFGAGVSLGMRYRVKKQWYVDFKGIFIRRLFCINSQKDMKDIKPYKAVWFNQAMTSWFIPDINICYAF